MHLMPKCSVNTAKESSDIWGCKAKSNAVEKGDRVPSKSVNFVYDFGETFFGHNKG